MAEGKVIVVHLRQPRKGKLNPDETRPDPFWEFGSFGCTGCHARNLLHPTRAEQVQGVRLAFVQGGAQGFKLVLLTPPVEVHRHGDRCEVRWKPARMPFRYEAAPLLVNNRGHSQIPEVLELLRATRRTTWMGRFSSRFRARRRPLPADVAQAVVRRYEKLAKRAPKSAIASTYDEALPYPPPVISTSRPQDYRALLQSLGGSVPAGSQRCGGRRKPRC